MAIKVSGTTVVSDSRGLNNIASLDATTISTIEGSISTGGIMPTVEVFTSSGTYTKPAGLVGVKVTVLGGGGGGRSIEVPRPDASPYTVYTAGGGAGASIEWIPGPSISPTTTTTVGAGGTSGPATPGGTSSFGAFVSATGGGGGLPTYGGAGGTGTGGDLNLTGAAGYSVAVTAPTAPGPADAALSLGTYGKGGITSPAGPGLVIVEEFF